MKKKIIFLSAVLILAAFTGCSAESNSQSSSSESKVEQSEELEAMEEKSESETEEETEGPTSPAVEVTASEVMGYLLDNTSNIGTYVEYDENTDVNGLLGRPGQYTSKINFAITTLEQTDPEDPKGGSIEVFSTDEDAKNRYDYIQSLAQNSPLFAEYDYLNGCVLLRINYDVAPSDEKLYEDAVSDYLTSLQ